MNNELPSEYKGIPEKTVIAMSTFYIPNSESNIIRAKLAEKTILNGVDLGYKIVVIDGGSSNEFLKSIDKNGVSRLEQKVKGMGPGRSQAFEEAYNTLRDFIAYTEPEKVDYVKSIAKTVYELERQSADIVTPKRMSLESLPKYQKLAEEVGDSVWNELTKRNDDVWFGPRTLRREMAKYFIEYNSEYGGKWDQLFIPLINALKDGKKIICVPIDYTHPEEQTKIEENNPEFDRKRIEQLHNLVPALINHWNKLNQI